MAKAASIASIEPDAVVIGGDQLVSFEGAILGKPGTTDAGHRPAPGDVGTARMT